MKIYLEPRIYYKYVSLSILSLTEIRQMTLNLEREIVFDIFRDNSSFIRN